MIREKDPLCTCIDVSLCCVTCEFLCFVYLYIYIYTDVYIYIFMLCFCTTLEV